MGKVLTPAEQDIEQLKKQLAEYKAKEAEYKAKEAELNQALAEKDEVLAFRDAIIDEQLQALEDAEAGKGKALPVVTHEGTQYQVAAAKFQHPSKDATVAAADLVGDKELLSALIAIGSGILVPIVK